MPSYRVTMSMGALRPGVSPESVLPAAARSTGELTVVEASDIAIVAGAARLTIRFMTDDTELAFPIAEYTVAATDQLVAVTRWQVTERVGGRWKPLS